MSPMLELKGVGKAYGRRSILAGVDLQVARGEKHVVIGPNGAGKSTLFHVISGYAPASAGQLRFDGHDITRLSPPRIVRCGLSRSFQVTNVFATLSVIDNLRCAALWSAGEHYRFWRRISERGMAARRADDLIDALGLAHRAATAAGLLSYAEQRTLEIGMAVAGDPAMVLLDEPTAGMSREETARAIELIASMTASCTLLMVEHDMSVVFGLADRISVLVGGTVLMTGTPAQVSSNAAVQEAYLGELSGPTC